ncbi:hypothetical protein CORC01_09557 [Colletotrichum orchidophilum]|uniref:Uncharacterized protein n=1 Tax=Colletotrichum orchidophilum TaxID=1209926 RepID=A0A1G4B165_9PEZI|nr:uncharacterized protein CORC01_09557 [Colletotrichum orchidophilum]OHE95170.1 hypothetical protein CORC01_09557 [Colletotrichum orchidophilum]
MATIPSTCCLALRAMWPPTLLASILALLVASLETIFYRADLSAAYHIFAAASIYLTLSLNAVIVMTRLKNAVQAIKDNAEVFSQIGPFNRWLVEGYLRSLFLLPNLVGPIWVCWVLYADNRCLDNLAHLYGFVIGMLHMPLLLSLAVHLVVPGIFRVLCWIIAKTSRLVWAASYHIPHHPCELAQRLLSALHRWLEALPQKIVAAIDRSVLRTEWLFLRLSVGFACVSLVCLLYTMIVDLYRPYLQRLAVHLTAEVLMFVGDLIFDVGLWVDGIVVKRGFWEGVGW